MSSSNSAIQVSSDDPSAEIKILDASANIVGRGIGTLAAPLAKGLYKIRIRVGSETDERLVAHDGTLAPQHFHQLRIPSPIPIDHTGRSHEYHQSAINEGWADPGRPLGTGSRLLISAREWSPNGSRSHPDPARALSIISASGDNIPFAEFAKVRTEGDACAIGVIDVAPGFYRVELALPDGNRLRRALHASSGWSTQFYMLFQDFGGTRVPNLGDGSVAIAKHPVVHDDETRLAEIALDALTQHRSILSQYMRMLLTEKFQQPLLGIIGAHLLLRDGPPGERFRLVVRNLTRMLGADHPDVIALSTRIDGVVPAPLLEPPMLRASWDLLVEASGRFPDLIAPDTAASRIAEFAVPTGAWLMWQPPKDKDDTTRFEAKLDVVRAYMNALGRTPGRRDTASLESLSFGDPSGGDGLGESARSDLSLALGIPRAMLDNMLTKL